MDEKIQTSFLGTGWSFPPAFSKATKGVLMTSDEEDIKKSLGILLSTRLGERIMQPEFGCDLTELSFEPLSTSLKTYITDLINTAILYHETRIHVDEIILDLDKELEGQVNITLNYTIKITNSRSNMVFPFYVDEGSNIVK